MGGAASPNKFKNEKQYFEYFNEELKKVITKFKEIRVIKSLDKVSGIKEK